MAILSDWGAADPTATEREKGVQQVSLKPNNVFVGYADVFSFGRRDFTTPNIDSIAAEGVRLTQAYANSPVSTASRVALITGRDQCRLAVGLEKPLSTRVPRKIRLPADTIRIRIIEVGGAQGRN